MPQLVFVALVAFGVGVVIGGLGLMALSAWLFGHVDTTPAHMYEEKR